MAISALCGTLSAQVAAAEISRQQFSCTRSIETALDRITRSDRATVGAQIAQMLRAIREGASTCALDRIAHISASIEMYLISSEAYGPGSELRNFVFGSQIEEL